MSAKKKPVALPQSIFYCEKRGATPAEGDTMSDSQQWDEILQKNKDETMQRWRAEVSRLRNWIDTEGRKCPSNAAVDAVLEESIRLGG